MAVYSMHSERTFCERGPPGEAAPLRLERSLHRTRRPRNDLTAVLVGALTTAHGENAPTSEPIQATPAPRPSEPPQQRHFQHPARAEDRVSRLPAAGRPGPCPHLASSRRAAAHNPRCCTESISQRSGAQQSRLRRASTACSTPSAGPRITRRSGSVSRRFWRLAAAGRTAAPRCADSCRWRPPRWSPTPCSSRWRRVHVPRMCPSTG